ncbi:hypothetical protein BJI67_04660 [Acidihalobacter aeolianus]|uniref:Uncharacterized protein n=1 Tax=Acidihalobacter aeolianus TaxID=2792603 RepID=A0A1D8K693_9GAMM|nr:hypothetical protein [Acidihalobacter aeolianus]AOV16458.1 hypothetical protein BJI67_04660 [Acidihalobacter aeolianus]
MQDSQAFKDALHKTLLAKTRAGRVFKLVVFWTVLFVTFVVPLGVLVIYHLWRHGNAVAEAQTRKAAPPTLQPDTEPA